MKKIFDYFEQTARKERFCKTMLAGALLRRQTIERWLPRHCCFSISKMDRQVCVDLVQKRDNDSYLCGLLMPASMRDDYFALCSFNIELASIKDRMSDDSGSVATQFRVEWWRNVVQNLDQDTLAEDSPVVRALRHSYKKHKLTKSFLERMLEAREADLGVRQYETVDDLISYAEHTRSSLLYLNLECCNVREDHADEVASFAGRGIGLVTAIRSTPFRLLQNGEMALPSELFRDDFSFESLPALYEGTETDIMLGESDKREFLDAVQHMAAVATDHLVEARTLQSKIPKAGRTCLLPVVASLQYLKNLQNAGYNVFDKRVMMGEGTDRLKLLALLGRTWLTGIL